MPQKEGEDIPSLSPFRAQVLYFEGPVLSLVVMPKITCWKTAAMPGRQNGKRRHTSKARGDLWELLTVEVASCLVEGGPLRRYGVFTQVVQYVILLILILILN